LEGRSAVFENGYVAGTDVVVLVAVVDISLAVACRKLENIVD